MLLYFSLKCRPYTLKNRYLQLYCIGDSILEGKFFQFWVSNIGRDAEETIAFNYLGLKS